jgi:GTP cyclohydrolase II
MRVSLIILNENSAWHLQNRNLSGFPPRKWLRCLRIYRGIYNYMVKSSITVREVASADFPTRWGTFRIHGFEGLLRAPLGAAGDGANTKKEEAVALVMGDVRSTPPLVRIHSQCLTGDVFGSLRCDCREQLEMALGLIAEAAAGVLIYEQQEGRGIGLMAKLQAYQLQDDGLDTVEANERLGFKADQREFALPAEILKALGISEVRLLSNNPDKVAALERGGVRVVERVPCEVATTAHAEEYLKTKKEKMGHLFTSR